MMIFQISGLSYSMPASKSDVSFDANYGFWYKIFPYGKIDPAKELVNQPDAPLKTGASGRRVISIDYDAVRKQVQPKLPAAPIAGEGIVSGSETVTYGGSQLGKDGSRTHTFKLSAEVSYPEQFSYVQVFYERAGSRREFDYTSPTTTTLTLDLQVPINFEIQISQPQAAFKPVSVPLREQWAPQGDEGAFELETATTPVLQANGQTKVCLNFNECYGHFFWWVQGTPLTDTVVVRDGQADFHLMPASGAVLQTAWVNYHPAGGEYGNEKDAFYLGFPWETGQDDSTIDRLELVKAPAGSNQFLLYPANPALVSKGTGFADLQAALAARNSALPDLRQKVLVEDAKLAAAVNVLARQRTGLSGDQTASVPLLDQYNRPYLLITDAHGELALVPHQPVAKATFDDGGLFSRSRYKLAIEPSHMETILNDPALAHYLFPSRTDESGKPVLPENVLQYTTHNHQDAGFGFYLDGGALDAEQSKPQWQVAFEKAVQDGQIATLQCVMVTPGGGKRVLEMRDLGGGQYELRFTDKSLQGPNDWLLRVRAPGNNWKNAVWQTNLPLLLRLNGVRMDLSGAQPLSYNWEDVRYQRPAHRRGSRA